MPRDDVVLLRYNDAAAAGSHEVVYLHGRGSSEREAGRLLPLLGDAYVRSYRGPVREGGGFAWFVKTAIAVAEPGSLAQELPKVQDWIGSDSGYRKPVLCGFSNGAAMAGSLMLSDPERYSGLIMIAGCLAVPDLPPGGLAGKPVLFCRGKNDRIIPREKFDRTQNYLSGLSGAKSTCIEFEGGHEVPLQLEERFRDWFASLDGAGGAGTVETSVDFNSREETGPLPAR